MFHKEIKVVSNGEAVINGYEDFTNFMETFTSNGCIAELHQVEANHDGTLTIVVNNTLPGEHGDISHRILSYKDDKIVHCDAISTDDIQFGDMLNRVSSLPHNNDVNTRRIRIM